LNDFTYDGLLFRIPDTVYEPAEDSFMLADAALTLKGKILEIGCGSGIVSLSNAKQNPTNRVLGVDINLDAVNCAKENAKLNKIKNCEFIESDLFSNIDKNTNTKTKFDAILFNPPYLPTDKSERINGNLNHAFDGGTDGRKVLDRFLDGFDDWLNPNGGLLLLQSTLNDPEKTKSILEEKGYLVEVLAQKSFFFEKLLLFKTKKHNTYCLNDDMNNH